MRQWNVGTRVFTFLGNRLDFSYCICFWNGFAAFAAGAWRVVREIFGRVYFPRDVVKYDIKRKSDSGVFSALARVRCSRARTRSSSANLDLFERNAKKKEKNETSAPVTSCRVGSAYDDKTLSFPRETRRAPGKPSQTRSAGGVKGFRGGGRRCKNGLASRVAIVL